MKRLITSILLTNPFLTNYLNSKIASTISTDSENVECLKDVTVYSVDSIRLNKSM